MAVICRWLLMFFCQEGKLTQQHAEDTNVLTEPLAAGLGTALPTLHPTEIESRDLTRLAGKPAASS